MGYGADWAARHALNDMERERAENNTRLHNRIGKLEEQVKLLIETLEKHGIKLP